MLHSRFLTRRCRTARATALECFAAVILTSLAGQAAPAQPVFSPDGPEADAFGRAQHYPASQRPDVFNQSQVIGTTTDGDTHVPSHHVPRAAIPWLFKRASTEATLEFDYAGRERTLPDFLSHVPVTGLLLIKDDTILYEHYQYGRTDKDRLVSNSMVKTIVAMLAGIALHEGSLRSIHDRVAAYLPALRGSLYGETTLRALLQMSSGIACDEPIAEGSDKTYADRMFSNLFGRRSDPVAALAKFDRRLDPEGAQFHYSSSDNEALTTLLRHAVGMPLSDYLARKIWQPMGAESDAGWAIDGSGQEMGSYGFDAVLRDYGRLGRLLAHDGAWEGRQLIPRQWVIEATTLHPADQQVAPGTAAHYYGYGYQVWILPEKRRQFALIGAGGQYVFVDPTAKLVLVQTAVRYYDGSYVTSPGNETLCVWRAFVRKYGQTGLGPSGH